MLAWFETVEGETVWMGADGVVDTMCQGLQQGS